MTKEFNAIENAGSGAGNLRGHWWRGGRAGGQSDSDNDLAPTGKGWGVHVSGPGEGEAEAAHSRHPPRRPHNGINYHNGPVMLGTVNIYFIWYGNWDGDSAVDILTDEAEDDRQHPLVQHQHHLLRTSRNQRLSNSGDLRRVDHRQLLARHLAHRLRHPRHRRRRDHQRPPAEGHQRRLLRPHLAGRRARPPASARDYCGWHTSGTLGSAGHQVRLRRQRRPLPQRLHPPALTQPQRQPRRRRHGLDHRPRAVEAVTDPDLNAWYDRPRRGERRQVRLDLRHRCYTSANGTGANVHWGARDFLVQQQLGQRRRRLLPGQPTRKARFAVGLRRGGERSPPLSLFRGF